MLTKILWWLWQFPQHLLGEILVCASGAKEEIRYGHHVFVSSRFMHSGVSLGDYIILDRSRISHFVVLHEHGHQKQSRKLGWLYLLIIGLPSITGNIWDRLFHRKWDYDRRSKWYYSLPWEAWANRLSGVSFHDC